LTTALYAHRLVALLRQAGHTVVTPADAGLSKRADEVHFRHAAEHRLVLVTKNPSDFRALHEQDRGHAGIFAICQDNDPDRDMSYAQIVAAIAWLEEIAAAAGLSIPGEFHVLNDWRR
jgi:hypothetical protein